MGLLAIASAIVELTMAPSLSRAASLVRLQNGVGNLSAMHRSIGVEPGSLVPVEVPLCPTFPGNPVLVVSNSGLVSIRFPEKAGKPVE